MIVENLTNLSLRDASLADLPGIVAIYNASIPDRIATADLEPVSVESRRPWFEVHSPEHRPLWVCEREGKMVAWLSFNSFYGRKAYEATAEVSIYIAPECQGQGIGKYLLEKALAKAPELALTNLVAYIFGHNAASIRLFEKYGFEQWGFLPGIAQLDGIERDLVILGKRLGR